MLWNWRYLRKSGCPLRWNICHLWREKFVPATGFNLAATRCLFPRFASKARVCIVRKANLLIYHPAPFPPPPSFLLPPASGGRWWRKVAQLVNWSLSVVNPSTNINPSKLNFETLLFSFKNKAIMWRLSMVNSCSHCSVVNFGLNIISYCTVNFSDQS